jgi:hypothetical protein
VVDVVELEVALPVAAADELEDVLLVVDAVELEVALPVAAADKLEDVLPVAAADKLEDVLGMVGMDFECQMLQTPDQENNQNLILVHLIQCLDKTISLVQVHQTPDQDKNHNLSLVHLTQCLDKSFHLLDKQYNIHFYMVSLLSSSFILH